MEKKRKKKMAILNNFKIYYSKSSYGKIFNSLLTSNFRLTSNFSKTLLSFVIMFDSNNRKNKRYKSSILTNINRVVGTKSADDVERSVLW